MRRFFLIVFGSFFLANFVSWFALDFILVRLAAPGLWRGCLAGFLILQIGGLLAIIGARLRGYQVGAGMGRPFLSLVMIWNMLLVLPTAMVSTVGAVGWRLISGPVEGAVAESWRIAALGVVALPFAAALFLTAVALAQLDCFRINRMKLTIPRLPPALRGFTIVHLSDLHIGRLTRGQVLHEIVAATNRLDADLIVLTGDLINMSLEDLPRAYELLRAMKARYGLFLCEGNHDLIESRAEFEASVRASGLPFLLNECATISVQGQQVRILGLRWGEGMSRGQEIPGPPAAGALQHLLAENEASDFTILLAHHPEVFDAAVAAGIPLTLAGHTHGGQLMLTRNIGFGPWFFRYWSGLYAQGLSRMIVSNGAGNWFPLRLNAPAEIIHLTLE